MRIIALLYAFLSLPAFVACAKSQSSKAPESMPREKALVIQAATLQQQALATQVKMLQDQIAKAEDDMKAALEEKAAYLREYDIKPGDEIDFKTGVIKRKPPEEKKAEAKAPAPAEPKKTASK